MLWLQNRLCSICFCSYLYGGLAYPDEVAFACSIALQAYFEGRTISREDMDKCVQYWRENIDELADPEKLKRDVCCEPFCVPCCDAAPCQSFTHPKRTIPYADEHCSDQTREVSGSLPSWRALPCYSFLNCFFFVLKPQ